MFFTSAVVSLSLAAAVQAGHNSPHDIPARLHNPLQYSTNSPISVSQNSTCSFDISSISSALLPFSTGVCPASTDLESSASLQRHSQSSSKRQPKNSSPWTNQPICSNTSSTNEESFCIYTSAKFAQNRGITFITTPHLAQHISQLPAFTQNLQSLQSNTQPPPFEIVKLPGRGYGLIANRTIQRGDRIKAHTAIAIISNDAFHKNGIYDPLMSQAISQLPSRTKFLFHAMAAHDPNHPNPTIERLNTNTFGEPFAGIEHSVVVPETARLNHDCRPNAMYYFDSKTLTHYTHASRTIYKGEEITITYTDPLQTRNVRARALKRSWGFECSCSLCSAPRQFVVESNRRIGQILQLTSALAKAVRKPVPTTSTSTSNSGGFNMNTNATTNTSTNGRQNKPNKKEILDMADLLVQLYEQERLYASIADAYRLAALAYSGAKQEYVALKWGYLAIEAHLIHDGVRSLDVKDMRGLVEGVRDHWSWDLLGSDEMGGDGDREAGEVGEGKCGCGGEH